MSSLLDYPGSRPMADRDVPNMVHLHCGYCEKTPCGSKVTVKFDDTARLDCIVCADLWPVTEKCPRCGR